MRARGPSPVHPYTEATAASTWPSVSPSNGGSPRRVAGRPVRDAAHHADDLVAPEACAAPGDVLALEHLAQTRPAVRRLGLLAAWSGSLGGSRDDRGFATHARPEIVRALGRGVDRLEERGAHAVRFERGEACRGGAAG